MEALIGIVLFVILYGLIMSGVGWLGATCYNLALAEPFGWPTLTWWQGALILVLAGMIFRPLVRVKNVRR